MTELNPRLRLGRFWFVRFTSNFGQDPETVGGSCETAREVGSYEREEDEEKYISRNCNDRYRFADKQSEVLIHLGVILYDVHCTGSVAQIEARHFPGPLF
jgi:hypothetical protein